MNIFFYSDPHFGHDNTEGGIIAYSERPFHDIYEMTTALISKWNFKVDMNDWVIHLGDFSFLTPEETIGIAQSLNGRIVMVNGNHDHRTRKFWMERAGLLRWFKKAIWFEEIKLSHWPDWEWKGLNIHGHVHIPCEKYHKEKMMINVNCELWDYAPVNILDLPIDEEYRRRIAFWLKELYFDLKGEYPE